MMVLEDVERRAAESGVKNERHSAPAALREVQPDWQTIMALSSL